MKSELINKTFSQLYIEVAAMFINLLELKYEKI